MLKLILILSLVLVPFKALLAQDEPEAPPPPPIREPLPPKVQAPSDEGAPEVVIRREDDRVVEEYMLAGRVIMIKVTPFVGPAYYLVDTTGDGNLDMRHDAMQRVKPAQWPIYEW